jgi:hypothetical protein
LIERRLLGKVGASLHASYKFWYRRRSKNESHANAPDVIMAQQESHLCQTATEGTQLF